MTFTGCLHNVFLVRSKTGNDGIEPTIVDRVRREVSKEPDVVEIVGRCRFNSPCVKQSRHQGLFCLPISLRLVNCAIELHRISSSRALAGEVVESIELRSLRQKIQVVNLSLSAGSTTTVRQFNATVSGSTISARGLVKVQLSVLHLFTVLRVPQHDSRQLTQARPADVNGTDVYAKATMRDRNCSGPSTSSIKLPHQMHVLVA